MENPFILSVEGPGYVDKGNWSTHKILGAFASREDAVRTLGEIPEDEIILLTELRDGEVERIE